MNRWAMGAAILVIVACGGGLLMFANSLSTITKAATSARTYADRQLPLLLRTWDSNHLVNEAHPKLLATTSPAAARALFGDLKAKLGNFQTAEPFKTVGYHTSTEDGIMVSLRTEATFSKQKTSVRMSVVRKGTDWQIGEFRVGT